MDSRGLRSGGTISGNAAAELFETEWQAYRKVVDNNYLFHREAYGALAGILGERKTPFRFLDIACGDASATVGALKDRPVAHYDGIDLSSAALELAAVNLAALAAPKRLHRGDLAAVLSEWSEPVDIAWIGLSLHHFRTEAKLALMREVRRILRPDGLLLIYENTSPDGEGRAEWMRRWEEQRPAWTAYSDAEWERMHEHVASRDFPEPAGRWIELGHEAGFGAVEELYVAPTDFFRLYCFAAERRRGLGY